MEPIDYTDKYFAKHMELAHPAGYAVYERIWVSYPENQYDQGEEYKTFHKNIYEVFKDKFVDKKVLFIGAAFGFEVEDFRSFGVKARGIDLNNFNMPHMSHGNALTQNMHIFDTVVGLRFISCLFDDELVTFFDNLGDTDCLLTVDDREFYETYNFDMEKAEKYYNVKTLAEWREYNPNIYSTGDERWGNSAVL